MRNFGRAILLMMLGGTVLIAGCVLGFFVALRSRPAFDTSGAPSREEMDAMGTKSALSITEMFDHETQVAPTYYAITGGLIFEDPRVNVLIGDESPDYTVKNTDDGLLIINNWSDYTINAWIDGDTPPDADISVTAQGLPPAPCDAWSYTLSVRIPPDSRIEPLAMYQLTVWSSKTWNFGYIFPRAPGSSVILASGSLPEDHDMMSPTNLRVVAKGEHFDLYINDENVGSADDPGRQTHERNLMGVHVYNCIEGGSALFTNLVVRAPR